MAPFIIRRLNTLLQLAFAFGLFLSANAIGNVWLAPFRIDLTQDRLFSLSPGAEALLDKVNEPITLKFYFSKSAALGNPSVLRYGRRVEDFLKEVERKSNGAVSVKVIDVTPFSPEEDEATFYGLQALAGANGQGIFFRIGRNR